MNIVRSIVWILISDKLITSTAGKYLPENNTIDSYCAYYDDSLEIKCSGVLKSAYDANNSLDFTRSQRVEKIAIKNCLYNSVSFIRSVEKIWRLLGSNSDHLTEIEISNCFLFDDLKAMIFNFNLTLPRLRLFTYNEDYDPRTCFKFCDRRLNSDRFLENLAKKAPNLEILNLVNIGLCSNSALEGVENSSQILSFINFRSLRVLNLSINSLSDIPNIPASLRTLNLSNNFLSDFNLYSDSKIRLETLDISSNKIKSVNLDNALFRKLNIMNASNNQVQEIVGGQNESDIRMLDLSRNWLRYVDGNLTAKLPRIKSLIIAENPVATVSDFAENAYLERIDLSSTSLETLNLKIFRRLSNLRQISLRNSSKFRFLYGRANKNVNSLERLILANCSIKSLPYDIFRDSLKPISIDIQHNPWQCDCRLNWLAGNDLMPIEMLNSNQTFCSLVSRNGTKMTLLTQYLIAFNETRCADFGSVAENGGLIRGIYGEDSLLDCEFYSKRDLQISWYRMNSKKEFSELSPSTKYEIYADGAMRIRSVNRDDVDLYACVAFDNASNGNVTIFRRFRLDYTESWWLIKIYSIACGILLAMAFFALNVISGALRRMIAWRLSNIERKGRVRLLLESMEKYRVKQMVNLQEMYTNNVNQIRDNYHQQVEALRRSYAVQSNRFKDYKNVQIGYVANQLDSLRDGYTAQMGRIWEYGRTRMDSVWLSYQRRTTTLREYTMQHRTRMMNRYKLKQGYLNRLLENLSINWTATSVARPMPPEFIELQLIELSSIAFNNDATTRDRKRRRNKKYLDAENTRRSLSIDLGANYSAKFYNNDEEWDIAPKRYCDSEPDLTNFGEFLEQKFDEPNDRRLSRDDGSQDSATDTYHSVKSEDISDTIKTRKEIT